MADSESPKPPKPTAIIKAYLFKHDETFRQLDKLRGEGWRNPEGDKHFAKQRNEADNARNGAKQDFYRMMIRIGDEMNSTTGAMTISPHTLDGRAPVIIDLCMAPGGFSASALKINPAALLKGLSLPPEQGGWEILLPQTPATEIMYQDMTMLAAEMGVSETDIPPTHPDVANFIHTRPFEGVEADIIFCGGGVQRLHEPRRAEYRQRTEATRLATSQLVFALNRLRTGGTLVMLMHRPDNWFTLQLLYTISQFADKVQCFKPKAGHGIRSSFYMVAKGVKARSKEGVRAVERWKRVWRRTTLGGEKDVDGNEDEDEVDFAISEYSVEHVLEEFGGRLIELGRPVWRVQTDALQAANKKWEKREKQEAWKNAEWYKKSSWR